MSVIRTRWNRKSWFVRRTLPGAAPGTLAVDPEAPKPAIRIIAYGPEKVFERDIKEPDEVCEFLGFWPVTWVDVSGLGDVEIIGRLGAVFGIHRLALEDVVNVHQRPKVEEYDKLVYLVIRQPEAGDRATTEQVSLFIGEGFVLSFQERPGGDCFDPVRDRIRKRRGRLRELGPDYLAYALLDSVVDAYFPLLERHGDRLDEIETSVLTHPVPGHSARIHAVRTDMLVYRRAIWPLRETLSSLMREGMPFVGAETRIYFRDVYDHVVQLMDLVESYRETAASLMEVYLSSINQRLNEVLKMLTILSTIFMPLTFIAGIYGMNFNPGSSRWNMPELEWRYGYPFSLLLMAAVALWMILYFRRKGWIGGDDSAPADRRRPGRR